MAAEPITIGYTTAKTVTLAIRRDSDLAWFDFNDTTFKTTGWTTAERSMTEQSGAGLPTGLVGVYRTTVDPAAWTDGSYAAYAQDSLVTTKPVGYSQFYVKNGTIVADALLDAAVTTRLAPTVAARTLDVSAGGEAGIDLANIGSPTTVVNLSGTTIKTATDVEADTADIQTRLPAALVGGRIDANTGAISGDAIAADNLEAALDGTGAVTITAGVTGNITGNLSGSVGSVTGAVGSVTAAVTVGTNNDKTGYALSAAGVQAIWDALVSALTTVGSIGKLLVDNVNATISSRATPAQVNTEVLDVLATDTFAEPSAVPAATSTLKDKLNWLFVLARNKFTQTATTATLRNDADGANIATATVSDDGTTFTRTEWS